jgi:hypothetical protein
MDTIRLDEVLKDLDQKESGNLDHTFGASFCLKSGERKKFPVAVKTGMPFSLKDNEMRGFQLVEDGKKKGHPTPSSIWSILEYNGKKVIL